MRPEKLQLAPRGTVAPEPCNVLDARVQVATYLGVSYQYTLEGPDGSAITAFVQNVDSDPPGPGAAVRITWRPEHSFVV